MTRKFWLALLALLLVTPAAAQLVMQPIQRPIALPPATAPGMLQSNSDVAERTMTIEQARARIAQLQRDKREADARLAEALATIEQMTSRGGSLVRAYCEGRSLSRNTAGASEDCGRYACGEVDGLCRKSCTASRDCAANYSCDSGQCLTAEEVNSRHSG